MICERKCFVSFNEALDYTQVKEQLHLAPYKCIYCPFFHLLEICPDREAVTYENQAAPL